MKKNNISQVPIISDQKLVGYVSDGMIIEALLKDKNQNEIINCFFSVIIR